MKKSTAKWLPCVPMTAASERRIVIHKVIRSAIREMAEQSNMKISAFLWDLICWYWLYKYDTSDAGSKRLTSIIREAYDE